MFGVHIWEICNFISLIWEVWSWELRELILKMENVDISGTAPELYWNYTDIENKKCRYIWCGDSENMKTMVYS